MLSNEQTDISGLNLIGFDDFWALNFDPMKVMTDYDDTRPTLFCATTQMYATWMCGKTTRGWILSGHTHGGQCKPPFLDPPILPVQNKRYSAGRIALTGGRTLYINRAVGHLWQVRFNVRPEITVFELEVV